MNLSDILVSCFGVILAKNVGWIKSIKDKASSAFFCTQVSKVEGKAKIRWPLYLFGGNCVHVGNSFSAGPGLRMECFESYLGQKYHPIICIGNNVTINYHCHIGCINRIEIGDDVLIGSNVLITDHSHGIFSYDNMDKPWAERELCSKGPVIIEKNVWIGENTCILSGVTIGKGSVIGAGSIVTHDIPAYSLAVGSPARVVKQI